MNTKSIYSKSILHVLLGVCLISTSAVSIAADASKAKKTSVTNHAEHCDSKHHDKKQASQKPVDDFIVMNVQDSNPHVGMHHGYQTEEDLLLDALIPDNTDVLLKPEKIQRVQSLKLSDEQSQQIKQLSNTLRERNWANIGKVIVSAEKLQELYEQPKRNVEEIDANFKQIFDLKREMVLAVIKTENQVYDLLTEQQRKLLSGDEAQVKQMH